MADYLIAIFFWVIYEAFSWPMRLALQPMSMSPDLRKMISRVAGPTLICFVSWVFSHFIIPLNFFTIWGWFAVAFLAAFWCCRKQGHIPDWRAVFNPITDPKNKRREWIIEAIGFLTFFGFLYFRRLAPEMTTAEINAAIAAEKFDNAMFFWSAFYTNWSPPDDYWLSGHPQAYYYFGHFFWAWIGRASLLPGEWVITLAMTRLVMLCYESCYLLARAFGARALSAAIGAFFVAWSGNPLAVNLAIKQYNNFTGRAQEPEADRAFILSGKYREKALDDLSGLVSGFDYWKPSRALTDGDITEYLAWTAILGDFHAHHLSIPWMLGWMAFVLAGDRWFKLRRANLIVREKKKKRKKQDPESEETGPDPALVRAARWAMSYRFAIWLACFLILGVASVISNLWMAPVVGLASLGILFWRMGWGLKGRALQLTLIPILALSMVAGIYLSRGTLSAPVASTGSPLKPLPQEIRSTVAMLAGHWGFHVGIFIVAFVSLVAARKAQFVRKHPVLFGVALWIFVSGILVKVFALPNEPAFLWFGFTAIMACFAWAKRPGFRPLVTGYICVSLIILAALELLFIDDPMSGLYERYNSYFKISYPVWPLLGVAAWMCVQRLWYWTGWRGLRWGFRVAAIALIPFVMTMTLWGFPRRTLMAKWGEPTPRAPTLNAVDWIEHLPLWRSEAQMLRWIRENIPPRTRIAEATNPKKGAYAFQGRVASLAGRPIPMGWLHHEGIWRGGATPELGTQVAKVSALYASKTKEQVLATAKELGVEWIVLGKVEREALGPLASEEFYQAVVQAQIYWQGFPADKPEVFLFKLPADQE